MGDQESEESLYARKTESKTRGGRKKFIETIQAKTDSVIFSESQKFVITTKSYRILLFDREHLRGEKRKTSNENMIAKIKSH